MEKDIGVICDYTTYLPNSKTNFNFDMTPIEQKWQKISYGGLNK